MGGPKQRSSFVTARMRLALLVALLFTGKGLEGVVLAGTVSVWVGFALLNGHFLWRQDREVAPPTPDERPTWRQTLALVEPSLWMVTSMCVQCPARNSSTELSSTSLMQ